MALPPALSRSARTLGLVILCAAPGARPALAGDAGAAPATAAAPHGAPRAAGEPTVAPPGGGQHRSPPPAGHADHPDPRVGAALAALVGAARDDGAHVAVSVIDCASGAVELALYDARPQNPASNTKLLTAAVALEVLGPDHRFTTSVAGRRSGDRLSPLVLSSDGNPAFGTAELYRLALGLRRQGVRHVAGILVDQRAYPGGHVPPAFDQDPGEWAPFRAPVSAVSIQRNSFTVHLTPGAPDAPAQISVEPPGVVEVEGQAATLAAPSPRAGVTLTVDPRPAGLVARLGGTLSVRSPPLRLHRRLDDPTLAPGLALRAVLGELGVTVSGDVREGADDSAPRLAYVESPPLGVLVHELGKASDNFHAEMLLLAIGRRAGGSGTPQAGAAALERWLAARGLLDPGTRIVNGSGLYDANRLTARSLTGLLRAAAADPRTGPEFIAQLATAGLDGTLRARLTNLPATLGVRAKSGTLDTVIALSGYLRDPRGGTGRAFAVLVEGTRRRTELRRAVDRLVEALAHSRPPDAPPSSRAR